MIFSVISRIIGTGERVVLRGDVIVLQICVCQKEGDTMEIREALDKDFMRIYELNRDALGYDYPVEKTWERLMKVIRRPTDKIYVACEDGRVVGYVHAADYECTYMDSLKNLMGIAVDAAYRDQGIGLALLEKAEKWAREEHCAGVRVVSGTHRDGAHEFYRSCGYEEGTDKKTFFKYF